MPDRAEAIRWALGEARTGDAVLISGKGDQQSQVIGDEEQFFDDREVAQEWLREVGAKLDCDEPPARSFSFPRGAEWVN